jgi:putative Mn2+ efflux pump MntP
MTIIGMHLGRQLGRRLGRKVEFLGGLILMGIGVKILIEHITA